MAITRMTLDEIRATPSRRDRAKVKATTEDDIRRNMVEDGEDPDVTPRESDIISPWYIQASRPVAAGVRRHAGYPGRDAAELGAKPGDDGTGNDRADAYPGA